ncbi:hypothetical protein CHS0354_023972 [Potamilus streckersoni]|uniref:ABC transporter domain-containing protein n=1 Tax=Potamilus streckersoni TaxID=2493646 RepID=A0AAE0RZ69_9BIVA|nr:hypothetical protein CHS0354_023972 [Potamilus streckersoni]
MKKLKSDEIFSRDQACDFMLLIGTGKLTDENLFDFISCFTKRMPTVDELLGFRDALNELAIKIDLGANLYDVTGTGGDGKNTFNISTTTMFILGGGGIRIAKHGSQSSSSVSGSSNVLEILGGKFTSDGDSLRRCLEKSNVCFLFAPLFHPALKHVAHIRKKVNKPTVFNMLGPLINPASTKLGMAGVNSLQLQQLYHSIFKKANLKYLTVHSLDGTDEVSLTSECRILTASFPTTKRTIKPEDFGFKTVLPQDIQNGGSIKTSSEIMINILKGKGTEAQTNTALANAALIIEEDRKCTLMEAVEIAKESISSGEEKLQVLKGINLEICKNDYVAIMGPSGSGKSTLMNILGCLDTPSEDSTDDELAIVRNKEIGFVFQTFNLLPKMTSLKNVELPLVYAGISAFEREQRATKALEAVGLGERKNHKPNELSGGQCQRVAVARALICNPSLILADEPTGNLDTKTSNEIMDIFEALHKEGNTIVLVTHEEDIAKRARRIIRLRDGVIESDTMNKT